MKARISKWGLLAVAVLVAGIAVLVVLVWRAQHPAEGVQPIVWDKEACAECGMAISTPAFAAQLQTVDGQVLDFDDPGCLLIYENKVKPEVRAIYFHAVNSHEWLSRDEVAFEKTDRSPMGYDLGAVPRSTPGAISYGEALAKMRRPGHKGD